MKKLLLGSTGLFRGFGRNSDGSTALTFGLGLTVMLLAMGTGIDFAMASKKQAQAQDLADRMGLAAAVYVKNHPIGAYPLDDKEGLQNGKVYNVADVGDYRFLKNGTDATIRVDYTPDEAIVTVEGSMPTTFMALAGIEDTDYSAEAVIKYHQTGVKASSVMMVLDNSGSMDLLDRASTKNNNGDWQLPSVKQERIAGLEVATKAMMAELNKVTSNVVTEDYVRTGMLPFEAVIASQAVPMGWGIIDDPKIDAMDASGKTNTAPPMNEAITAMNGEAAEHAKKGHADPLKYVIFMTDGVNTVTTPKWKDKDNTTLFRRIECYEYSDNNGWSDCRWKYGIGDGTNEPVITYAEGQQQPRGWSKWWEGELRSETDYETLRGCESLKASGVEVYAIGFATEPGTYHTRDKRYFDNLDEIESHRILSFMQECSSGPGYFMKADDSAALSQVFAAIGKSIWEKSIYVSR